ncbi:PIN domain-containing protein [Pedobacter gandavensis]|uniref:PIN domain-containing protein n=1 Tax=Pedobacter gandavensis TaxID=2679963 RepID=UPI002931D00E|nr:PIN domain-containing protein [Pedobacter gandavensis]
MIHLYIDTNAYLTFYHLSSDDLEELKKLLVLVKKTQEITLHLPEQTFDEFNRNREVKIADAIKRFREEKLTNQFPQMSKDYPEFKKMKDAIKQFDESKAKLLEKLMKDVLGKQLAADKLIEELFSTAQYYETDKTLINLAKLRFDLGKPPGKNKSYGDALNWETLIAFLPEKEDLYFISDDKDFYSEIVADNFNSYLLTEWKDKKHTKLYCYRRISDFFKENFPSIKIASEYEKELLISELGRKGSFSGARQTLIKLSQYEEFSSQQLQDFINVCMSNNQVFWIKDDLDIKEMILNIIVPNKDKIDNDLLADFFDFYKYA